MQNILIIQKLKNIIIYFIRHKHIKNNYLKIYIYMSKNYSL